MVTLSTSATVLLGMVMALWLAGIGREGDGSLGIGLPLARQFVEGHGGTLSLLSQVGEGTVVTIELPRG